MPSFSGPNSPRRNTGNYLIFYVLCVMDNSTYRTNFSCIKQWTHLIHFYSIQSAHTMLQHQNSTHIWAMNWASGHPMIFWWRLWSPQHGIKGAQKLSIDCFRTLKYFKRWCVFQMTHWCVFMFCWPYSLSQSPPWCTKCIRLWHVFVLYVLDQFEALIVLT